MTKPGRYNVTLGNPFWERLEPKPGDNFRMVLVIPCEWTDQDGQHAEFYRMYFSKQIAQKGRNAGQTLARINADECIRLGMSTPFDPVKVGELQGKTAELVMVEELYDGELRVVPRYLNPVSANRLQAEEAREFWRRMTEEIQPRGQPGGERSTALSGSGDDDIPF